MSDLLERAVGVVTHEHIPDDELADFTGHIDRLLEPEGVLILTSDL